MEIRKVPRINVIHITGDESGFVTSEILSDVNTENDIVSKLLTMDDLIVGEKELRTYVEKALVTPGLPAITISNGEAIPVTSTDAAEWERYGTPTEIVDFFITHEADIEVIINGMKFKSENVIAECEGK